MKELDISKSVYELASQYPEIVGIMAELGFKDITNPFTLKTTGKVMTIPKGCRMKGLDIEKIVERLKAEGFEVKGLSQNT